MRMIEVAGVKDKVGLSDTQGHALSLRCIERAEQLVALARGQVVHASTPKHNRSDKYGAKKAGNTKTKLLRRSNERIISIPPKNSSTQLSSLRDKIDTFKKSFSQNHFVEKEIMRQLFAMVHVLEQGASASSVSWADLTKRFVKFAHENLYQVSKQGTKKSGQDICRLIFEVWIVHLAKARPPFSNDPEYSGSSSYVSNRLSSFIFFSFFCISYAPHLINEKRVHMMLQKSYGFS